MDPFKKRMIALGGLLVVVVIGILVYRVVTGGGTGTGECGVTAPKRVQLTWWGDLPESAAQSVINAYVASRPYVSIAYTQLDPKTSEQQLIEAWARGTGPDIYAVRNEQLRYYAATSLLSPMPEATTSYTTTTSKQLGIKEVTETCRVTRAAPSAELLQNTFVTGAFNDIYRNGQVLGFPLQFDSIVMFYNQQLLDEAGVLTAPKTWEDVRQVVPKLTLLDDKGAIVRAGAAIGRSANVPRMPEILAGLFLQYQVKLTDPAGTQALFPTEKATNQVVEFASSFGNSTKVTYTWDETFPSALDALAQGKVAIAFGTLADLTTVRSQTTGADIRVAAFPQGTVRGTSYIADYWVQTVAPRAVDPNVAWDFLRFSADTAQVQLVLQQTGGTPAIRTLVEAARVGAEEGVTSTSQIFAQQAATAVGWFAGVDAAKARTALNGLVDDVATRASSTAEAIDRAASIFVLALRSPS